MIYLTFNRGMPNHNVVITLIARFMEPTWGPSGADRTQVGFMLAVWTLISGNTVSNCVIVSKAHGKYQMNNRIMFSVYRPGVTQFNPFKHECNAHNLKKAFLIPWRVFMLHLWIIHSQRQHIYVNQLSHHWLNDGLSPVWMSLAWHHSKSFLTPHNVILTH